MLVCERIHILVVDLPSSRVLTAKLPQIAGTIFETHHTFIGCILPAAGEQVLIIVCCWC